MWHRNKSWLASGCMIGALCGSIGVCLGTDQTGAIASDVELRAMSDEVARAKTLALNTLDKPYFVSYGSSDIDEVVITGSLGGLNASRRIRMRSPRIEVRVGSYEFDNTNSVYSGTPRLGLLPLDDEYEALRTTFWLSTDAIYKAATDQITRKRGALREMADADKTPDLAPAPRIQLIRSSSKLDVDKAQWEGLIRQLSGEFSKYPNVLSSSVRLLAAASTYRFVSTEGTVVRIPQDFVDLSIRASGLASDGSPVWNHEFLTSLRVSALPDGDEIARIVKDVATGTDALEKAPQADEYSGPVLFEQEAAAQMMAEVLADASRLQRRPLSPPGGNERPFLESVWAARVGTKVAPDWMTIVDDPRQTTFQGKALAGQYEADDEGVMADKVLIVDKGTLKGFLLSREPVRNYRISNGHGRLPGSYGAQAAVIGNLFVQARDAVPEDQMKGKLIERVKAAGLKYGVLIRRLDFPSTANREQIQGLAREMQKEGFARTLTDPLLAFRVYPDGREELIRGARFKEFSAKDMRDVLLASDRPYVLNYVNNGSSFDFADLGSDETTSTVVCPSLLFDSLEMDRARDELTKPPIVPPPTLLAQQ